MSYFWVGIGLNDCWVGSCDGQGLRDFGLLANELNLSVFIQFEQNQQTQIQIITFPVFQPSDCLSYQISTQIIFIDLEYIACIKYFSQRSKLTIKIICLNQQAYIWICYLKNPICLGLCWEYFGSLFPEILVFVSNIINALNKRIDRISNNLVQAFNNRYKLIMRWKKMSRYGMKLALNQIQGPKKILSLDVGSMSTGVAVSCSKLQKSYLLKVLNVTTNSSSFIRKLRQTIKSQQNIKGIIVGRPIYQDSQDKINKIIDELVKTMEEQPPSFDTTDENKKQQKQLLYCFEDETWTTKEAKDKLKQFKNALQYHGHIHKQKQLEDGIAAMKIMERFLAYYNNAENK